MKQLMTKHFSKWLSKQKISEKDLSAALSELQAGYFEASLGGHLYKKRIRFEGQGKSGSGRTIICYKKKIELFSYMDLQRMKNRIYQKKNSRFSKNYPKFYWLFRRQK
jgi:hypothetical protein